LSPSVPLSLGVLLMVAASLRSAGRLLELLVSIYQPVLLKFETFGHASRIHTGETSGAERLLFERFFQSIDCLVDDSVDSKLLRYLRLRFVVRDQFLRAREVDSVVAGLADGRAGRDERYVF